MHIAYGCKSLSGIGGVRFQSMGEKLILNYQNVQVGKNCKRRRREAAIAEGKKPLTTKGSGEPRKLPHRRDFEQFSCKMECILSSCYSHIL